MISYILVPLFKLLFRVDGWYLHVLQLYDCNVYPLTETLDIHSAVTLQYIVKKSQNVVYVVLPFKAFDTQSLTVVNLNWLPSTSNVWTLKAEEVLELSTHHS